MQKFYIDKSKLFECNISVDGADISETKARLIMEFPNKRSLLFHGSIDSNGKCSVNVPPLKEMQECEGNVMLEIIADSTYFESWSDTFKLIPSKKVQVEMIEDKTENIVINNIAPKVNIISETFDDEFSATLINFNKYLKSKKIDFDKVRKNKNSYFTLMREYKKEKSLDKNDISLLVEELNTLLKQNKLNKLLTS